LPLAVQIAEQAQRMRGFGHVKERNVESVLRDQAQLLEQYRTLKADSPAALVTAA
jgi:hypothetical protein